MNDENDWRERYRQALTQLSEEEARWIRLQNALRLLVGRLCLAAQGRDARLDGEIGKVAHAVRRKIEAAEVESLLGPLSEAVAALDTGGPSGRHERERDSAPATDSTPPDLQAPPGAFFTPGPAADQADAARPAPTDEPFDLRLSALLDRLALLPGMRTALADLRHRRPARLEATELVDLLDHVSRVASEAQSKVQQEKHELESLLIQLTARLDEITAYLKGDAAERKAADEDTDKLSLLVTDEVEALRTNVQRALDLVQMRGQVYARLDAINTHVQEFRVRQEARVRSYRDRVGRMRTRISELERESRNLQSSLQEEQRLAMIDALTGIPNRAAYDDRVEEEHKRWKRFGEPLSILAWDIDRFKAINDAYGHKAGDKVLRVIGQHLAHNVRETDFVARYGGEEFVMLLVGASAEEARSVADKIRLEIAALGFHFHDSPVTVTASCGITTFREGEGHDEAFDRADRALYRAKEAGRNCCVMG